VSPLPGNGDTAEQGREPGLACAPNEPAAWHRSSTRVVKTDNREMDDATGADLETYRSICERDVDMALILSLRADETVRAFVAGAAGVDDTKLVSVRHSMSTTDGREADLELRLGDPELPWVVEVENKLDAPFQPGQAEGYRRRREEAESQGGFAGARSVLICPRAYSRREEAKQFDGVVTYEALRGLLSGRGAWADEVALILDHALQRYRRGPSNSEDDPAVTEFFAAFTERALRLGLPPVPIRGRKAGAGFLWWPWTPTLAWPARSEGPQQPCLCAKFVHGNVDIELYDLLDWVDEDDLRSALLADSESVEFIVKGKRSRLRRRSHVLDPQAPIGAQEAAVNDFLERLADHFQWWQSRGVQLVSSLLDRGSSAE
jgi:hypothetical protein